VIEVSPLQPPKDEPSSGEGGRKPFVIKHTFYETPEEALLRYQSLEKYKPYYAFSRTCCRITCVFFYIWFLSGLLSFPLIFQFSLGNIMKLAMICVMPCYFCNYMGGPIVVMKYGKCPPTPDDRKELMAFYESMRTETLLLGLPLGIVIVVCTFLPLFKP
jgi:hypothetical protein